jgi:uncharacterized tellurite resistance protein B-like protein
VRLNIQRFFEQYLLAPMDNGAENPDRALQIACAALLIEMIRVDHKITDDEIASLKKILRQHFSLQAGEEDELIDLAERERDNATDYFQFTSLINQHYSQQQKRQLVTRLWQLANADNHIDKFEEHLVRKLADLLHVPHAAFIRSKYEALSRSQANK